MTATYDRFTPLAEFRYPDTDDGTATVFMKDYTYTANTPALQKMVKQWVTKGMVRVVPPHEYANRPAAHGTMETR